MKRFAVIGLGNVGHYLAVHLYEKGHEVLAIDSDPDRVQAVKDKTTQAVLGDATDREVLKSLELDEMDRVVVTIGSVLDASILVTLGLKDVGVPHVIAMAISEPHGRILQKVGASEVFFPEKDVAVSLAERLHNPNMLDYLPFLEGYSIVQIAPPESYVGKRLKELDLINTYGIQVVAVRELVPDRMNMIPTAKYIIKDSDTLVLLGPDEALETLQEKTRG
jgi:trk system potassium uptake protein TrkA